MGAESKHDNEEIQAMSSAFLRARNIKPSADIMFGLEAARWFADSSLETRRTGRTTCQIVAALEKAMRCPGQPVKFGDHSGSLGAAVGVLRGLKASFQNDMAAWWGDRFDVDVDKREITYRPVKTA
jgi:hypothetical protein